MSEMVTEPWQGLNSSEGQDSSSSDRSPLSLSSSFNKATFFSAEEEDEDGEFLLTSAHTKKW